MTAAMVPDDVVASAVDDFLTTAAPRQWSAYRDVPWDEIRPELLTDAHRSAVGFVTVIEDHLPGYVALYTDRFPVAEGTPTDQFVVNRELYRFTVKWAEEEDRHAHALFRYQVAAGMADADALRRTLAVDGQKRFDLPFTTPVELFTYTFLQEKATQLFYQRFAKVVEEPVLAALLRLMARDEGRHFVFFSHLLEAHIRQFGADLVPGIRSVVQGFKMPLADTMTGYWRWALRSARTAGYDHTEAYEDLARLIQRVGDAATRSRAADLFDLVDAVRRI